MVRRGHALDAWEVKASALGRAKLPRAARSFIDAYEPARFTIVNLSLNEAMTLGRTEVRWVMPEVLAELGD